MFDELKKFIMTTRRAPIWPRSRCEATGAFTRADLLAMIVLIGMLAVLTVKSIAGGRSCSQATACLNNHRRLVLAWRMYADDTDGRLVGNLDGAVSLSYSNRTWVLGWLDYTGAAANTNTDYLTRYSPLAPYAGRSAEIFRCPLNRGSAGVPRVRSVSMNGYLGERSQPWTAGFRQFRTTSDLFSPGPRKTFVFLDEREESINDGFFIVDMSGYPSNPDARRFLDFPAPYHNVGSTLSFADGHAETKRWADSRTAPIARFGQLPFGVAQPNNPDALWLQERSTSRAQ